MGLKKRVKEMRIVRKCWAEETCKTKDDCRAIGCPYVGKDCEVEVILDALALVEILWQERKELKKRVRSGQNEG